MNPLPKIKILIVDDEKEIVSLIESFLQEEGYETLTALDGAKAFELIEKEKPDLVLLDLNIPKMSGFQILERIKPKESGLKVLIFSGLATKQDQDKALALGASGYLNKPIQLESLLQTIEELSQEG